MTLIDLAEIKLLHGDVLAEIVATERAADALAKRLGHLSRAIEDLRMRVGSRELNRDVRDLYTAVPSIVCAKLSEGNFNFGTAEYLPPAQRQIRQWVMDLDSVMALVARK
jgi:hypothetical protein